MELYLVNQILYTIIIADFLFYEPIKVKSTYKWVKEISLSQEQELNENYRITHITLTLDDEVKDDKEAKNIGSKTIDDILNKLAFKGFKIFGEPEIKCIKLKNQTYSYIDMNCEITLPSNQEDVEKFRKVLESHERYETDYYRMYRDAVKNSDVVARYMFLYSILASIVPNPDNKEQKNVDKFIKNELNKQGIAIEERKSTKWSFKTTVLTWLRNEVGHTTKKSNIDKIKTEMKKNIDILSKLVRLAIIKYS